MPALARKQERAGGRGRAESASALLRRTLWRQMCGTFTEAEELAERLVRELGAGQIAVYDAELRLRTVKQLPSTSA